jgi:hypothetical protein
MTGYLTCHNLVYSLIAQSVERRTVNPQVAGSNPARGAIYGEREALVTSADCKSVASGIRGSNPWFSTKLTQSMEVVIRLVS